MRPHDQGGHEEAPGGRRRVLVVGGGIAGLATAFHLTATEARRARFQVTILQPGWRLGGKLASQQNAAEGFRNEEHGLHILFGFYHNVFALLREVYAAWEPPAAAPFRSVETALTPCRIGGVDDHEGFWPIAWPEAPGEPGAEPTLLHATRTLLRLGAWLARSALPERSDVTGLAGSIERAAKGGWGALAALGALRPSRPRSEAGARAFFVLEFVRAIASGLAREVARARPLDLDTLDGQRFPDWLAAAGMPREALASPFVRGLCRSLFVVGADGAFDWAAGAALRTVLLFGAGYRGPFAWLPRGGMGDVLVSPLYDVLRARGVQLRFFHAARRLTCGPGGAEGLEVDVQLEAGAYEPRIDRAGWPVWPHVPNLPPRPPEEWAALERGETPPARTVQLRRGEDFDELVLAVPAPQLVALGLAAELGRLEPSLADGLPRLPSLASLSAQLWMDESREQLRGEGAPDAGIGGPEPLDVWADMSHVLAHEAGSGASAMYLCGVLTAEQERLPTSALIEPALARHAARRWPRAGAVPAHRLHVRRNEAPSERSVPGLAGTVRFRPEPGRVAGSNVSLAGAWCRTPINSESVEAAVWSAGACAGALLGEELPLIGTRFLRRATR